MRPRGRKRPADAQFLLEQVAEVFKRKKEERGGVRRAANEVGVCVASFYKYMAGTNVPDMKVLRAAEEKWGVKWKYLDASEVFRAKKVRSAEQLVFSFLSAMQEKDIEIVEVEAVGKSVLRISLNVRIPA